MSGNTKSGRVGKIKRKTDRPKAVINVPKPPTTIKGEALKYWKEIAKTLVENQIYTPADYKALEILCSTYGDWKECEKSINKNGVTYETTTDRGAFIIKDNPALGTKLKCSKMLDTYLRKFGLTPIDRKGIPKAEKSNNSVRERYK